MLTKTIISPEFNKEELSWLNKKDLQVFKEQSSLEDKENYLNSLIGYKHYMLHQLENKNILVICWRE